MLRLAGDSPSPRPLVTRGIALDRPPVPVPVPTPVPVRLNHTSSVNVDVPRPGAAPNVTYWLEPLKLRALFWAVAWAARAVKTNAKKERDARENPRIAVRSAMIHL